MDGWGGVQGCSLPTQPVSPDVALPNSCTQHPSLGICSPAPGHVCGANQAAAPLLQLLEMGRSRIQCWRGPQSHDWEVQGPQQRDPESNYVEVQDLRMGRSGMQQSKGPG